MDGDKPKMSNCGMDDWISFGRLIEPYQEARHLRFKPFGFWRLKMHTFAAIGA